MECAYRLAQAFPIDTLISIVKIKCDRNTNNADDGEEIDAEGYVKHNFTFFAMSIFTNNSSSQRLLPFKSMLKIVPHKDRLP